MEVDLCGHATLATAYILSNIVNQSLEEMNFHTASGILKVIKKGDLFELDFPSRPPLPVSFSPMVEQAIRMPVVEALLARDLFVVVESEQKVRDLEIDEAILNSIPDLYGLVITTTGETADFVSRYFTPNCYPPEDPVCGSSHSALIPYWAARLGKDTLVAKTLSKRGGTLYCQNCGDRVKISGKGVLYLEGEIRIK
jgi:predicted PhzF superfamily epimerase YddE/YHI9